MTYFVPVTVRALRALTRTLDRSVVKMRRTAYTPPVFGFSTGSEPKRTDLVDFHDDGRWSDVPSRMIVGANTERVHAEDQQQCGFVRFSRNSLNVSV